jgi:hypothetical protein
MLTLLSYDEETDFSLVIKKDREGFYIDKTDASVDGLKCKDIQYLKAHPNMTDVWNHFMVVMDQSENVKIRKVTIKRNKKQQGLKIYPFQRGVKLIDTFSITDTCDFITEDPNFAVVSLRQGTDATKKCTVTLDMLSQRDLHKIEHDETGKYDYWNS